MATGTFIEICWDLKLTSKPFNMSLYILCVYLAYVYLHMYILNAYKTKPKTRKILIWASFLYIVVGLKQSYSLSYLRCWPSGLELHRTTRGSSCSKTAAGTIRISAACLMAIIFVSIFMLPLCLLLALFPAFSPRCLLLFLTPAPIAPCNLPSHLLHFTLYKRKQDSLIRKIFKNYSLNCM